MGWGCAPSVPPWPRGLATGSPSPRTSAFPVPPATSLHFLATMRADGGWIVITHRPEASAVTLPVVEVLG